MGIAEETDRTLFVGNLDQNVTEELLFELFLQAGPLVKVKIPKDPDGKKKSFGFAVFKHDESAPYGMKLLNGTTLFGRSLKVQFRAGSTHMSSPGQDSSPVKTPSPHGAARYDKTPEQMSPSHSSPQHQRAFTSPDSLQRQVLVNNMWQVQMQQLQLQQLQQITGGFPGLQSLQHQTPQQGSRCGNGGGQSILGAWQDSPSPRGHRQPYQQDSGSSSHHGRDQRYTGSPDSGAGQRYTGSPDSGAGQRYTGSPDSGAGSNRHHRGQRNDHYQHDDRSDNRSRNHQDRWKEGSRDSRWRRY